MYTRTRVFVLVVTLIAVVLFQPAAVRGTEAAADSTSINETERNRLSLLFGLDCGLGGYKNLSKQRGDPPNPIGIGSHAFAFKAELGLEALGWGISYNFGVIAALIPTPSASAVYDRQAGSWQHRIRGAYALRRDGFHLIPESGYFFLEEYASIDDRHSDEPGPYKEKYNDRGYYYGLSARVRLKPVLRAHWWLYARYVHDNLDIKTDSYQLELQLGDEFSGPQESDEKGPDIKSAYFSLGVKWSKKTDGRSEWFITLGCTSAIRLL
jgi:hypothetical protein